MFTVVHETESTLVLFINYCIIFYTNNYKPIVAHHVCIKKLMLKSWLTQLWGPAVEAQTSRCCCFEVEALPLPI